VVRQQERIRELTSIADFNTANYRSSFQTVEIAQKREGLIQDFNSEAIDFMLNESALSKFNVTDFVQELMNEAFPLTDSIEVNEAIVKYLDNNGIFKDADRVNAVKDFKNNLLLQHLQMTGRVGGESIMDFYRGPNGIFRKSNPVTVVNAPVSPINSNITSNQMSEFTNHSGGALGADIAWDTIGQEFGMNNNQHYWMNNKTPKGNAEISQEDAVEGQQKVTSAARNMGRINSNHQVRDERLIRNWSQVKYADAVFAITTMLSEGSEMNYGKKAKIRQGKGGTGYAIQMAIEAGKPVYVYDQIRKQWYKNIGGVWSPSEVPTLTKNFAGIGTRELNKDGEAAIKDVYAATIAKNASTQPSTSTKPILKEVKEGIYVNQDALTKEEQLELFDYLKPFLEEQAAKTNKGLSASKMIGLGLRWDYKSNNPGKAAMNIPDVINPANATKYGYYNTSINNQPLADITPRFKELMQKATGIDMTNYDGAIINLYEANSFISSHNDVDESKSASNYPVIGINIGGSGNFSIESRDGNPLQLNLRPGAAYVFGKEGKNRDVYHRTFAKAQDSFLPALTTKIDGRTYEPGSYRITITMRRVMPLEEGMPTKPAEVVEQLRSTQPSTKETSKPVELVKNMAQRFDEVSKNPDLKNNFLMNNIYINSENRGKEIEFSLKNTDVKTFGREYREAFMELLNSRLPEVSSFFYDLALGTYAQYGSHYNPTGISSIIPGETYMELNQKAVEELTKLKDRSPKAFNDYLTLVRFGTYMTNNLSGPKSISPSFLKTNYAEELKGLTKLKSETLNKMVSLENSIKNALSELPLTDNDINNLPKIQPSCS
jgi:hypothetical protein